MGTIVVGVDDSEHARRALGWALDEARTHGSRVVVVHAWTPATLGAAPAVGPVLLMHMEAMRKAAQNVLDAVVDEVLRMSGNGVEIERRVLEQAPARALIDVAKHEHADLLVTGSRGRGGFSGLLLGSVSSAIAHHTPCPLAIIPRPREQD